MEMLRISFSRGKDRSSYHRQYSEWPVVPAKLPVIIYTYGGYVITRGKLDYQFASTLLSYLTIRLHLVNNTRLFSLPPICTVSPALP